MNCDEKRNIAATEVVNLLECAGNRFVQSLSKQGIENSNIPEIDDDEITRFYRDILSALSNADPVAISKGLRLTDNLDNPMKRVQTIRHLDANGIERSRGLAGLSNLLKSFKSDLRRNEKSHIVELAEYSASKAIEENC